MKKNTKKMLTLSVFAAFALSMSVGIGSAAIAKAADEQQTEQQAVTADFSDFTLNEKASVRKISPKGIRFQAIVGEKTRASLAEATDVTFGMLIAPTLGADEKLTLEDVTDKTVKARNLVTKVWTDNATSFAETTSFTYNSALVGKSIAEDFPADKYATPLNAVGYVQYTDAAGTKIVYTANSATRSLVQSASLALANGESDSESVLSGIIDSVVPDALSVGAVAAMEYGTKTTLTAEGTRGLAVIWSSSDEDVATVDKLTGEVTAVGIGTAEITATLGTRTATTTVSVQDKAGVISVAHFATQTLNGALQAREMELVTDETQGTVAKSVTTATTNNGADWWVFKGEQYKYFSGYDYIEITMKADVTSGSAANVYFYPNKSYALESDETSVQLSELNAWKTVRFNDYSSKTTANDTNFTMINDDSRLAFHVMNTSQTEVLNATMYFAGVVGGYSDFETAHGTPIDLTAKYNGVKSATITPTGETEGEEISNLTSWTPVEGTLSFTVGQEGWFDNSYTVNVTVADPVGTVSARTIAQNGVSSDSGATLTSETDATYGTVAVWKNVTVQGNSSAHLTISNDLYADFANYDYLDFRIKIVPATTNTSTNGFLYFNKKEYPQGSKNGGTVGLVGYATIQEWTTVTFAKAITQTTANETAFGYFERDKAVSVTLKNNNSAAQAFTVYIAYIQVRNAEA